MLCVWGQDSMEINEDTKVPLFKALGLVGFLSGGIVWATMVYYKADTAVAAIETQAKRDKEQDDRLTKQMDLLIDIRERVIRIETNQKEK